MEVEVNKVRGSRQMEIIVTRYSYLQTVEPFSKPLLLVLRMRMFTVSFRLEPVCTDCNSSGPARPLSFNHNRGFLLRQ